VPVGRSTISGSISVFSSAASVTAPAALAIDAPEYARCAGRRHLDLRQGCGEPEYPTPLTPTAAVTVEGWAELR
jgi:hypothetical protein